AGGRSTGHSLAPSTQIQFMNNQSKKCLSEQHCAIKAGFFYAAAKETTSPRLCHQQRLLPPSPLFD
ncbi:MAG: hypothetical protein E7L31_20320, partial [Aeromonas sp.]|nr:hypothetical protein [Aeromonas sp.]